MASPKPDAEVIRWLLDADPSIRWQVMRDLTGAPAHESGGRALRVLDYLLTTKE